MEHDQIEHVRRLQQCAAALLADDAFCAILRELKSRVIREWADTSPLQKDKREVAYFDLQAVARLETYLEELKDGKILADRKDARKQGA